MFDTSYILCNNVFLLLLQIEIMEVSFWLVCFVERPDIRIIELVSFTSLNFFCHLYFKFCAYMIIFSNCLFE